MNGGGIESVVGTHGEAVGFLTGAFLGTGLSRERCLLSSDLCIFPEPRTLNPPLHSLRNLLHFSIAIHTSNDRRAFREQCHTAVQRVGVVVAHMSALH